MSKKLVLLIVIVALSRVEARNYTYEEIKHGFHKILISTFEIFHNVSAQAKKSMFHIAETTNEIKVCLANKNIVAPVTLIPENLEAHFDSLITNVENIKTAGFWSIGKILNRGISTIFKDPANIFEAVGNDTVTLVDAIVDDLGDAVEKFVDNSCGEFKKPIYQLVEAVQEIK